MKSKNQETLHPIPENCPVCSGDLYIRELKCPECETRIKGRFENRKVPFKMDEELFEFLKVFIFAEGNIKQSEKIMNCSYPKIKNLLKKTKAALGFTDPPAGAKSTIIDALDQGKIDVDAALEKLKNL